MGADADQHHAQSSSQRTPAGAAPGRRGSRIRSGEWTFALALTVTAGSALALWVSGESEWPMLALAFGGLLAGRVLGLPARHLALIGLGVVVTAWPIALFSSPIPGATSTLAHVVVAALLAAVIADPVRSRWPATRAPVWSARWFAIPAIVLAVGSAWELGEWTADALLGTDLAVEPVDTVTDLAADLIGAVAGLAARDRFESHRHRRRRRTLGVRDPAG